MEINEALDTCLAGMLAPSERLLALASQLSRQKYPAPAAGAGQIPPTSFRGLEGVDGTPPPAGVAARNRLVLGNARATLRQALEQTGGQRKA